MTSGIPKQQKAAMASCERARTSKRKERNLVMLYESTGIAKSLAKKLSVAEKGREKRKRVACQA
jgi:hypothetical protein